MTNPLTNPQLIDELEDELEKAHDINADLERKVFISAARNCDIAGMYEYRRKLKERVRESNVIPYSTKRRIYKLLNLIVEGNVERCQM